VIAWLLILLFLGLWSYWGVVELYYEGWGNPWHVAILYLMPAAVSLVLAVAVLQWPRAGGVLLIVVGVLFTLWWWLPALRQGNLTWQRVLSQFPLSALLIVIGALFLYEGRRRRMLEVEERRPGWWRRWQLWVTLAVPLLIAVGVSAYHLPIVLARVDDGGRGARTIAGNSVALVWAPAGPGWNWKQPWGGYPSWNSIALYGDPPVGIDKARGAAAPPATGADMASTGVCRYLDESGTRLLPEPADLWRMPTVDEIARSLVIHGRNAGCAWDGTVGRMACAARPDKETPLWAPNEPPIYYWAADEHSVQEAYYVSYNGYVSAQPKSFGNPRHGYRCVREPVTRP
jgi:hypothetical protein